LGRRFRPRSCFQRSHSISRGGSHRRQSIRRPAAYSNYGAPALV
jgi:hypothetical protein